MKRLNRPPIPRSVPIAPAFRRLGPRLSQFVEVRPEVKVDVPISAPISIELGALPLSIGLFAGSGVSFLVRSGVPAGWPQTVATALGAALAVAGVVNLVLPKAEAAPAPSPAPRPVMPSTMPGVPSRAPEPPYVPPQTTAFAGIEGRIVEPTEGSEINLAWVPWISNYSYPVHVKVHNTSTAPVTFELEITAHEDPVPTGSPTTSGKTIQVTAAPGEIVSVPLEMQAVTWTAGVDYINVTLEVKKRRIPGEAAQMLDIRGFTIE